jgi:hypothetical protein
LLQIGQGHIPGLHRCFLAVVSSLVGSIRDGDRSAYRPVNIGFGNALDIAALPGAVGIERHLQTPDYMASSPCDQPRALPKDRHRLPDDGGFI